MGMVFEFTRKVHSMCACFYFIFFSKAVNENVVFVLCLLSASNIALILFFGIFFFFCFFSAVWTEGPSCADASIVYTEEEDMVICVIDSSLCVWTLMQSAPQQHHGLRWKECASVHKTTLKSLCNKWLFFFCLFWVCFFWGSGVWFCQC